MAFKTFADGSPLPEGDLNTYLMKQAVIVCTAGTRPASPIEGMTIYETDTDKLLIYTTATTLWQQPWNMPWGYVTSTEASTTNQSITSGSYVDITGLTGITATNWPANRRMRLQIDMSFLGISGTNNPRVAMAQTSGPTIPAAQMGGIHYFDGIATNYVNRPVTWHFNTLATGAPGTYVVKVIISNSGAGGTFEIANNQAFPTYAVLEDIGPAGAPA